jgi:hypothetical protein
MTLADCHDMDDDPLDIASQQRRKDERVKLDRLERETEEADVRWLASSRRGRRILWRILEQSGVFRLSYAPSATAMAFNEGQRSFGNRILALIHDVSAESYPAMLREQRNHRHDERLADAGPDSPDDNGSADSVN